MFFTELRSWQATLVKWINSCIMKKLTNSVTYFSKLDILLHISILRSETTLQI